MGFMEINYHYFEIYDCKIQLKFLSWQQKNLLTKKVYRHCCLTNYILGCYLTVISNQLFPMLDTSIYCKLFFNDVRIDYVKKGENVSINYKVVMQM